ncbi:hypothetical protein ALC57_02991, partial [Trachymyrmex cornetzi]
DKVFLISHPKYHINNFNFIIKTFLDNDYQIKFIFDTINLRLRSLLKCKTLKQADKSDNNGGSVVTLHDYARTGSCRRLLYDGNNQKCSYELHDDRRGAQSASTPLPPRTNETRASPDMRGRVASERCGTKSGVKGNVAERSGHPLFVIARWSTKETFRNTKTNAIVKDQGDSLEFNEMRKSAPEKRGGSMLSILEER